MGTDGSYASEPSEAVEFEALIGTEISPDSALIAKEKLGFERDSSGEHNTGTIVIDAPDNLERSHSLIISNFCSFVNLLYLERVAFFFVIVDESEVK